MNFVDDYRNVIRRSYSFWAMALSGALFIVPEGLFAWFGVEVNPYATGKVAVFLFVFGLLGRLLAQDRNGWGRFFWLCVTSVIISALIILGITLPARALERVPEVLAEPDPVVSGLPTWEQTAVYAVPLVAKWEGLETTAYLDTIAQPPVWTICYGETFNVQAGETRSADECQAGLNAGLERYWSGWRPALTINTLAPQTDAAFTSLSWNIGVGALRGSTALRRLNAGDVAGGCDALTWWNKAGDRVVWGLVNRRDDEHALCMEGVL